MTRGIEAGMIHGTTHGADHGIHIGVIRGTAITGMTTTILIGTVRHARFIRWPVNARITAAE